MKELEILNNNNLMNNQNYISSKKIIKMTLFKIIYEIDDYERWFSSSLLKKIWILIIAFIITIILSISIPNLNSDINSEIFLIILILLFLAFSISIIFLCLVYLSKSIILFRRRVKLYKTIFLNYSRKKYKTIKIR